MGKNNKNCSINVLMSTYNGEKYIREQIDSILAQQGVDIILYIRDDGSIDGTVNIIEEYSCSYENVIFINPCNRKNVGHIKSFLELMKFTVKDETTSWYAFADQDDVWLPEKLASGIGLIDRKLEATGKANSDICIFYYSNKIWTDKDLNVIHNDSKLDYQDDYLDFFAYPPVFGCTVIFNRTLLLKAVQMQFPERNGHDVFMFRLSCLMDSIIVSDTDAHILYRRHGNNASSGAVSVKKFFIKYFLEIKHKKSYHGMQKDIKDIYQEHSNDMGGKQKRLCELIINYDKNFRDKIALLVWKDAYTRGIRFALIWIGRVILNAI